MTKYEYYKDQYKRTAYPLIDEKQFDELVAEIRAEIANKTNDSKAINAKKTRRMTNRELSDLIASGKAEKCYPYNVNGIDLTRVYRTHSYYRNREDSPCAKSILIRYIGTNEWVKPLIEE